MATTKSNQPVAPVAPGADITATNQAPVDQAPVDTVVAVAETAVRTPGNTPVPGGGSWAWSDAKQGWVNRAAPPPAAMTP